MYIKSGQNFFDYDLHLLSEMLEYLDVKIKIINNDISLSLDPYADGLCDRGEYFIGVGFSLIQNYISNTYPQLNIKKTDALKIGETIKNDLTYVKVLNAGANYWKHEFEWGLRNCITKDIELLTNSAKKTIKTIEQLTPWADYTCSNLLAILIGEDELILSSLMPYIESWRIELDNVHGNHMNKQAAALDA